MRITIIAAVARNGVIGHKGKIPWHLPGDLAHFKRTTMGHTLVMGRRTFESTGALPGRRTLVLTRDPNWEPRPASEGGETQVRVVRSLEVAIEHARDLGETELFICGGENVYRQGLPLADRMILTRVEAEFEGEINFPEPCWERWHLISSERHEPNGFNLFAYTFVFYESIKNRRLLYEGQ